jgi:hypothetical protein
VIKHQHVMAAEVELKMLLISLNYGFLVRIEDAQNLKSRVKFNRFVTFVLTGIK